MFKLFENKVFMDKYVQMRFALNSVFQLNILQWQAENIPKEVKCWMQVSNIPFKLKTVLSVTQEKTSFLIQ